MYQKTKEMNPGEPAIEYLQLAVEHFLEISDKLIPNGFENGQVSFTTESLKKWQNEVSSIESEIFLIYLFWCGYLIG